MARVGIAGVGVGKVVATGVAAVLVLVSSSSLLWLLLLLSQLQ